MRRKRVFSGLVVDDKEKCTSCDHRDECIRSNQALTAYGILIDCEAFYYVFCEIERAEQLPIFDSDIDKYKKEFAEYYEVYKSIPFLMPALMTNGALAFELAMKFLIFNENGEFECGHDLAALFSQMPKLHSEKIKQRVYKELVQDENTFIRNMEQISNVFVDGRYFFEHEGVGYTSFFTGLVHITCDYVLLMKEKIKSKMD